MAKYVRISDGSGLSAESILKNRIHRVNAILKRSEDIVKLAQARAKTDPGKARFFRKRAHDEARMAMRLMGILVIEYNIDMMPQIAKTKMILKAVKNGSN